MNKKIFGILICVLFVVISALPNISNKIIKAEDIIEVSYKSIDFSGSIDVVDQSQESDNGSFLPLAVFQNPIAQSFIPSMSPLTKIDLFIYARGMNHNLKISVRNELDGSDLVSMSDIIFLENYSEWVTFDFMDINVDIGYSYYIVIEDSFIADSKFQYGWLFDDRDPYENGSGFIYKNGKWSDSPNNDMCFRTYSKDESPEKPIILGKSSGKPNTEYEYTFVATDPDGDEISYFVDWGDNTSTGWTSELPSGVVYNSSHIWSEKGDYTIQAKAKDKYGAESDWTTLTISMRKSKEFINPFLKFLENHPNLFPLLRQLLGL